MADMQSAYNRLREIDDKIQTLSGAALQGFGSVSQAGVAALELGVRPPPEERGNVVDGPFTFIVNVPAAVIAPNAVVGDLTTYAGATGTGPVSRGIFPNFTPTDGKPDALLFISSVKYEVGSDTIGSNAALDDLLECLELEFSVQQGMKSFTRPYPLSECGGTVTHYSSAATTVATTTINNAHKKARELVTPDIPPIYLPTATFQVRANGRGVPVAPSAPTQIYFTFEGFAIQSVKNAFDIVNSWTNPSSKQRVAFDEMSMLLAEKRMIRRALGYNDRRMVR